jgi:hypothetical protein
MTSAGWMGSTGPPQRCTRPEPRCHDRGLSEWVRVPAGPSPGFERYDGGTARAGFVGSNSGSIRTAPVKYSASALPDGCEPLRLISISTYSVRTGITIGWMPTPQTVILITVPSKVERAHPSSRRQPDLHEIDSSRFANRAVRSLARSTGTGLGSDNAISCDGVRTES